MTADQMAHIHALCFTTPRPWSAAEFSEMLASPSVFMLHIADGFALGRLAGPEAELLTIAIHPDAQGKGKGCELLQKFIESIRQNNVSDLFLEVAETNFTAIKLYESAGFATTGRRAAYYKAPSGPKIAAITMKYTLPEPPPT
ncbi:MAG: ribosomal protein S18-alanine N-acetyltransferase [Rhodobacteraceae bacterium]|nr:ribosomal protein S18-alanine N-acetyltransferase [Paracoccaceae bacterium]